MTKYVPISPEEIAEQTYQVYQLGVSMVHIHARDKHGNNTNDKEVYGKIIKLIREKCPAYAKSKTSNLFIYFFYLGQELSNRLSPEDPSSYSRPGKMCFIYKCVLLKICFI